MSASVFKADATHGLQPTGIPATRSASVRVGVGRAEAIIIAAVLLLSVGVLGVLGLILAG